MILYQSFIFYLKQLWCDTILRLLIFMPFLIFIIYKWFVPHLITYFMIEHSLYVLFDIYFLLITPILYSYISCMVIITDSHFSMSVISTYYSSKYIAFALYWSDGNTNNCIRNCLC